MALLIKTIFFKQTKIVKKTAFARNYLYKPPHPQLILSLRKERNVIICREAEINFYFSLITDTHNFLCINRKIMHNFLCNILYLQKKQWKVFITHLELSFRLSQ